MNRRQLILLGSSIVKSDDTTYLGHMESRGVFRQDFVDVHYPINPKTGLPVTDLSRLINPNLSEGEKESIFLRLGGAVQGSYLPKDMSDDEIMAIIPPRFLTQDQVDIQMWRDYLTDHVLPTMSDAGKQAVETEAGSEAPQNENNPQNE